jgi:hypothetical protein
MFAGSHTHLWWRFSNKPRHNGPLTLGPPQLEEVIVYKVAEIPPIPGQGLGPMFKS